MTVATGCFEPLANAVAFLPDAAALPGDFRLPSAFAVLSFALAVDFDSRFADMSTSGGRVSGDSQAAFAVAFIEPYDMRISEKCRGECRTRLAEALGSTRGSGGVCPETIYVGLCRGAFESPGKPFPAGLCHGETA
ncbi:hypothetical protein [Paraburkholderia dipogonis]|uniref:hypothetical protein n=1 Tax=Paraburkholderia dipogonis TaxID=1211383 RepID=UPI0038BC9825